MTYLTSDDPGVDKIRAVIHQFLQERLQTKLDKLKAGDEEKRAKLINDHQPANWLPDAAKRVGQIQQVTHALKFSHSYAKGTSLSSAGNSAAGPLLVGTHSLGGQIIPDVVGNAAALDVYKFLSLKVDDKSLLSLAAENSSALQKAFSDDEEQAQDWLQGFAGLTQAKGSLASHKLSKQLYWPLADGGYHLLSPLFSTSLVHHVWSTIRQDRFSDEAKAAREARSKKVDHPQGYREYPNIVVQKFGGTQPQNVSQLNSQRYGENYLLPSVPPSWESSPLKPPLGIESVFDRLFFNRKRVKSLVRSLRKFLYSVKEAPNNIRIRNKRIELIAYIIEELLFFAAELRDLEAGWTVNDRCKLNLDEQCWFDPYRADTDADFSTTYSWGDWQEAVCDRFANALNARLSDSKKPLPFGKPEADQWKADLKKSLSMLRLEVS